MPMSEATRRVMLLMSPSTYRASAFLKAASTIGVEVVSVVDMPEPLREYWHQTHGVDFADIAAATDEVVRLAREDAVDAVLSIDDSATELAALASARLGLPHNAPDAAVAARDKFVMRSALATGGVRCPHFETFPANGDPTDIAARVSYPCVVKPLRLSGSRGVIRANDADEFVAAFRRLQRILSDDAVDLANAQVLVEEYLAGDEVAVEGLLTDGELHVLAIFDKPDRLVGPFFEETIYVTPSRHPAEVQRAIGDEVAAAAGALGLRNGPVHAELRVNEHGPWILEVAGRSIGGLCSTILSFGSGMCLEEMILRHAVGMEIPSFDRDGTAVGVMMIPIPKAGMLKSVEGEEEALQVPGITGLEITAKLNYPILPLPEGASYLGFIFARGASAEDVEAALREAHARLIIRIDPIVPLLSTAPAAS
jgi:biotin carboxylase